MRWYSTIESAEKREFSVLAAVETVVAMGISLWIVHKTGSVLHILVSACIAPFLLLRTRASTRLGLDLFLAYFLKLTDRITEKPNSVVRSVFGFIVLGLAAVVCRLRATLSVVACSPLRSIGAIGKNWYDLSLVTDSCRTPEVMPGYESLPDSCPGSRVLSISEQWYVLVARHARGRSKLEIVTALIICSPVLIGIFAPVYLPALLYRFTLKSTSLIYIPLIWLVSGPKLTNTGTEEYIEDLAESPEAKISLGWALIVIATTALSISYILLHVVPPAWLQSNSISKHFLPIEEVGSWHVTRLFSALLALPIFCWAANILRKQIRKGKEPKRWQVNTIWCGKMLQKGCALWTIGCGLYLLFAAVQKEDIKWENLPGWRWLPVEVEEEGGEIGYYRLDHILHSAATANQR